MLRSMVVVLLLILAAPVVAYAQAIRPLATDRPDRTESPYSVPRGYLQVEMDLVTHGEFTNADETLTGTSIASFNAKYGITDRVDLQFVFSPFVRLHYNTPLIDETDDGTGQAGVRAKINLAGNDSEGGAAALLPFVFVPTRGDAILDAPTWGMVTPVSIDLGNDRAMSSMIGAMRVENDEWWVIGSVSFATPIAGNFAGFFEVYVARAGFEADVAEDVTTDVGLTFAPSPDWQFDAGVYYGITDPTEDWRVFAGASARFPL